MFCAVADGMNGLRGAAALPGNQRAGLAIFVYFLYFAVKKPG
jgi:hypothetical protein